MNTIESSLISMGCNPRMVSRYIKVLSNAHDDEKQETHHALPRSLFPEYEKEEWNLIPMSSRRHFICHLILYRMKKDCKQFQRALWFMQHTRDGLSVNSRTYAELQLAHREWAAQSMSNTMKGKSTFEDDSGNRYHLHTADPMIKDKGLSSIHLNQVCVFDNILKTSMRVGVEIYRHSNGRYVSINKGRKIANPRKGFLVVKDHAGNTYSVSVDDPRVKSGELVSINKGMVNVIIDGVKTKIPIEEFNRGGYTHSNKGFTDAFDSEGNMLRVRVDDPRFISGEITKKQKSDLQKRNASASITAYNKSCIGKKWMTSPEGKSKQISPEDVEYMLSLGWKYGRENIKGKSNRSPLNKGAKWMKSPDGIVKQIMPSDIDEKIAAGWKFGRA